MFQKVFYRTRMMADKTFFDYASAIQTKSKIDYDDKAANAYMLMLHFSHDNQLLETVNKVNEQIFRGVVPNKAWYQYFYNKVPRGKRWIRWVNKNKIKDAKIEGIMERTGCSRREAEESVL